MAALVRSGHTTYCPYKGDASYTAFRLAEIAPSMRCGPYETPFEAMAQIKDYVAFYPDRVGEITQHVRKAG
jgi:uncharacterized protein (DUF427 family)